MTRPQGLVLALIATMALSGIGGARADAAPHEQCKVAARASGVLVDRRQAQHPSADDYVRWGTALVAKVRAPQRYGGGGGQARGHGHAHAHAREHRHTRRHGHAHAHGHRHGQPRRLQPSNGHGDRYADVQACAEAAHRLAPGHVEALHLEGLVLMDSHAFTSVTKIANRMLAKRPDHAGAYILLSDAYLEQGKLLESITAIERAQALKPGMPTWLRLAHLSHLQGDNDRAKALYRRAIAAGLHGTDREAVTWAIAEAARLFLSEGDRAGAQAGIELALTIDPTSAAAREVRASMNRE